MNLQRRILVSQRTISPSIMADHVGPPVCLVAAHLAGGRKMHFAKDAVVQKSARCNDCELTTGVAADVSIQHPVLGTPGQLSPQLRLTG
jgi:hypothetical protein